MTWDAARGNYIDHDPEPEAYEPAGTPEVEALIGWLIGTISGDGAHNLSSLAARAHQAFEAAPAGSALEATMAMLCDMLNDALIVPEAEAPEDWEDRHEWEASAFSQAPEPGPFDGDEDASIEVDEDLRF